MTVQTDAGTFKEKAVKKSYPAVEGTDFGTTKFLGKKNLPCQESLVSERDEVGFT